MITSQEIGELAAAMAKAQAEIKNPVKEKENTFFKNSRGVPARYADLPAGLDCIRPALSAQDIAVFQVPTIDRDNNLILRTRLIHSSGQWIEGEYLVCKTDLKKFIKDKNNPDLLIETTDIDHQKIGSALTYVKRQSLFAMVGVAGADDDDDGNGAVISINGPAAVTATQAKLIRDKIILIGADEAKFLEFFKVGSIEGLRSSDFRTAIDLLAKKSMAHKGHGSL